MTKVEFLTALRDFMNVNHESDISKIVIMMPEDLFGSPRSLPCQLLGSDDDSKTETLKMRFVMSPSIKHLWFCSHERADQWLEENK